MFNGFFMAFSFADYCWGIWYFVYMMLFLLSNDFEEVINAKSRMVNYNLKSFCLRERRVLYVANQTYFLMEVV
jgi:hypothetical protein